MTPILTIFKKEMRDTLRDRRTLVSSIVMPVILMPLLILGMGWFAEYQAQQTQEKDLNLGIVNRQAAPDLASFIDGQQKINVSDVNGDAAAEVRQGTIDLAILIPADWQTSIANHSPIQLTLLFNSTKSDSSTMLARVTGAIKEYDEKLVESRMQAQGLNMSVLTTPVPALQDVATSQERGGFFLGFLLPMFLVLWSIMGGMYTAIDASAGEKERKTLEALLTAPVRRIEIVLGKLLAVSTTAVITVTLALASLYIAVLRLGSLGIFGQQAAADSVAMSLALSSVLVMFGVGVLLAIMFGALELSLSIFAKSYREANSYLTPLYLIAILPVVVVNTMTNLQPGLGLFFIPAVNAVLLFKELLLGTLDASHILVTLVSLALFALAAIAVSANIYKRESVLFRS